MANSHRSCNTIEAIHAEGDILKHRVEIEDYIVNSFERMFLEEFS